MQPCLTALVTAFLESLQRTGPWMVKKQVADWFDPSPGARHTPSWAKRDVRHPSERRHRKHRRGQKQLLNAERVQQR